MSKIKKCFKSRWGDDGVIMEADYSQLEVIGLAFLSQDKQLYQDILDGLDMHCINASFLYGEDYSYIKAMVDAGDKIWVEKRKTAKAPGFLIQYGGGAKAMAAQTDLPERQCKQFIINYYDRYKGVKAWQDSVMAEVRASRKASSKRTATGKPAGVGEYVSITGRKYSFQEYDNDYARPGDPDTSFSPTQMKNYPVQGFATGDIVPIIVGKLFRVLKNDVVLKDKALLINTIHDSIILDVHKDVLEKAAEVVKTVMESAPQILEEVFGFEFDLPLKVDVEAGDTWFTKKKLEI